MIALFKRCVRAGNVWTRHHFDDGLDHAIYRHHVGGDGNGNGDDGEAQRQRQPEELRETVLLHVLPVVGRGQLVPETAPEHPHETVRVRVLRVQGGQGRTACYPRFQGAQQTDVLPVLVRGPGPGRPVRPSVRKQSVSHPVNCALVNP